MAPAHELPLRFSRGAAVCIASNRCMSSDFLNSIQCHSQFWVNGNRLLQTQAQTGINLNTLISAASSLTFNHHGKG